MVIMKTLFQTNSNKFATILISGHDPLAGKILGVGDLTVEVRTGEKTWHVFYEHIAGVCFTDEATG